MDISIVSRGNATKTKPDIEFVGSFKEFSQIFENYNPNRDKHDGYFVRGKLEGTRKNDNLPKACLLVLDGDKSKDNEESAPDPQILHRGLKFAKINHFIYTTHSHNPPKKVKWRCVIPCKMASKEHLKPTLDHIFEFLETIEYPLVNVKENWTWSQAWFFPNRQEDDGVYSFFSYFDGRDYDSVIAKTSSQQVAEEVSEGSYEDNVRAIREGISYYKEMQNIIYGMAKDGRANGAIVVDMEMMLLASKAASPDHPEHEKWQKRYHKIKVYVKQAKTAIADEEVNLEKIKIKESQIGEYLEELEYPPGLIGDLCRNFYDMAPHPNKEISIMGGISLVAGIVGRKYNVMGTGLNIYATLLADSGIGKAVLKDGINLALRSANALSGGAYVGSSRFTGPKAVFEMLSNGYSRVCVLEESGLMNESSAGDGAGLSRVLLDLYTSSGSSQWAGAESYSSKDNNIEAIQAPALTIVNVSTPKSYLKAMKSKSAELSGEIARMWIIRSLSDKPYLNINRKKRFDEEVLNRLSDLTGICLDRQTKDQLGEVIQIKFEGERFQKDSNDLVDKENLYKREGDHLRRTLCSRAFVKIMKLAAICSVYNDKEEIGEEEYQWAKNTVAHEMRFIEETFTYEASDDMLRVVKNIIAPNLIKSLRGEFLVSAKNNSKTLSSKGIITRSCMSQIFRANSVVKELDDDLTRPNPKTGIEKIIEYMRRNGYFTDVTQQELVSLRSRAHVCYKITNEFKMLFEDK